MCIQLKTGFVITVYKPWIRFKKYIFPDTNIAILFCKVYILLIFHNWTKSYDKKLTILASTVIKNKQECG